MEHICYRLLSNHFNQMNLDCQKCIEWGEGSGLQYREKSYDGENMREYENSFRLRIVVNYQKRYNFPKT